MSVQGEVGVSYFPRPVREIISEDKLDLVDRMYQPGDLLKRSVDDVRSGIVTRFVLSYLPQSLLRVGPYPVWLCICSPLRLRCSVYVQGRLEHAISTQEYPSWLTARDVESVVEVDMGDYVVYNDWVGQVRIDSNDVFVPWHDLDIGLDRLSRFVLECPLISIVRSS